MTQGSAGSRRVPEFATREEEAEFWDTHDITDYLDELKPVQVRFSKRLTTGITVRLTPEALVKMKLLARQKGVGPSTLARMWILERLEQSGEGAYPPALIARCRRRSSNAYVAPVALDATP